MSNREEQLVQVSFSKFFEETTSTSDYVVCHVMHSTLQKYIKHLYETDIPYDRIADILNEHFQLDDTIVTRFNTKCYTKVKFKHTDNVCDMYTMSYREKYT
jgi:hypothetical protein